MECWSLSRHLWLGRGTGSNSNRKMVIYKWGWSSKYIEDKGSQVSSARQKSQLWKKENQNEPCNIRLELEVSV